MHSPARSWSLFVRTFCLACVAVSAFAFGCAPRDAKSPPTSGEPATFVKVAPRVGRIAVEDNSIDFRLDSEARAAGSVPNSPVGAAASRRGTPEGVEHPKGWDFPGSRVHTESVERERRREEILAVFDRIVTKKRITYEVIERTETRNGSPVVAPPSPLSRRSYIVEAKQSVLVFTDAAGAPVSDAEQKELARRSSNLGKPDPFLEGLPDGPVYPGGPAVGMAAGFLEMFEGTDEANREGPDVGKVDVHFVGVREEPQGRCGVFAFTIGVQMAGEPRLSLDLNGEFWVRISDSAPIRLEARGPARLVGRQVIEGVNVQMTGSGQMIGTLRVTYL